MQVYVLLDIALMHPEAESGGQDILVPSKIKNKIALVVLKYKKNL